LVGEGRTALVMGASSGIGRACAIALAQAGAQVWLAAYGIRVVSIAPTFVETPMTKPIMARPDITGTSLVVDGAGPLSNRLPHPRRARRHVEVPDAVRGERVDDRVHHRGHRTRAARPAAAFHPERVGRRRHGMALPADRRRRVFGTRQRVVHERAGEELALGVVARVSQGQLGNMESISKCFRYLLRLAEEEVERHVAGNVVVELRRTRLGRLACERHRRQRLDVKLHRLGRVLRLHGALGRHARHRVAHEPYFAGGERAPDRPLHRRSVALLEVQHALVRPVRRQVRAGIDGEHPRHFPRRLGIHSPQHPVRVRASHHVRVRLPWLVQVVGIAALAGEELRVLRAAYRLADVVIGRQGRNSRIQARSPRKQFAGSNSKWGPTPVFSFQRLKA
jgi:hypothetical protein